MSRQKYDQVYEGDWVRINKSGHKIACCGCGLVHKFKFKIENGKLFLKAYRDNRATGQIRRHMRGKSVEDPDCYNLLFKFTPSE